MTTKSNGPTESARTSAQRIATRESSTLRAQSSMARRSISTSSKDFTRDEVRILWAIKPSPQPKSAPRPENSGKWRISSADPGSIRSQENTPGWVHRPSDSEESRRARVNRGLDRRRIALRGGDADSMVALGAFVAGAAQFRQLLGETAAALVLGGHDEKGRAGRERAQGKTQRAAALDGAGRREHGEIIQRPGGQGGQIVGAGAERRELTRIGREIGEFRRRRAKQNAERHSFPGRSGLSHGHEGWPQRQVARRPPIQPPARSRDKP